MRRLKILWFWVIPWGFIKQRCHYLAEGLSRCHDLTIVYQRVSYEAVEKLSSSLKFKKVRALPFEQGSSLISAHIGSLMWYFQVARDLKMSDMIWFSHPYMFGVLKYAPLRGKSIVYDCADDVLGFSTVASRQNMRRALLMCERELVQRSEIIFTSSSYLKDLLLERHSICGDKVFVINNAIDPDFVFTRNLRGRLPQSIEKFFKLGGIKLIYIGSIADWLDMDLILESVKIFDEIRYLFVGHLYKPLPSHERIHYVGSVRHSLLLQIMEKSDILVMPFKRSDLVLAVDPIKLYEYISAFKPIIAVRYPEVEKFKDFAYFYESKEEYLSLVRRYIEGRLFPKGSPHSRVSFLRKNTWNDRIERVLKILREKYG